MGEGPESNHIPAIPACTASNACTACIAGSDPIASTRHPRPRSTLRPHQQDVIPASSAGTQHPPSSRATSHQPLATHPQKVYTIRVSPATPTPNAPRPPRPAPPSSPLPALPSLPRSPLLSLLFPLPSTLPPPFPSLSALTPHFSARSPRPFPPQPDASSPGLPASPRPVQSAPQGRNPVSPRPPSPPCCAVPVSPVAVRARSSEPRQSRKKSAQTVSGQPAPSGGRLARDSSPLHPQPNSTARRPPPAPPDPRPGSPRRSPSHPGRAPPPCQDLTHPRHTPSPVPVPIRSHSSSLSPLPFRPRPAAPQEFFRKNSYCAREAPFRALHPPTPPRHLRLRCPLYRANDQAVAADLQKLELDEHHA